MKRLLSAALALLILVPETGSASVFDLFFDDVKSRSQHDYPTNQILDFVIDEMRHWGSNGIVLTRNDVKAALAGTLWTNNNDGLCQQKVDNSGVDLVFTQGTAEKGCMGLRDAIVSLVQSEKEADLLGDELLMAANGAELSIADEPHRPVAMGTLSLLLKRVWSGTGAGMIPWDGSADTEVDALDSALSSLDPEDLEKVILRFHFGYFRDLDEQDPRFSGIGTGVQTAFADIASILDITGSGSMVGEFMTPKLKKTKNVAFWARKDDLGIQWIYPPHFTRFEIKKPDQYPVNRRGSSGSVLAYPFEYTGTISRSGSYIHSPLCSRTVGKQGYLCRRIPIPPEQCVNTNTGAISLVECSVDSEETLEGPDICGGLKIMYKDDGTPLIDPLDAGRLNPALKSVDTKKLCSSGALVQYQDDVTTHACYIGYCLAQSMSGHTIAPNRNTVVTDESTSPYLSCMRADPELGLYTEAAHDSPFILPPYVGHLLVQDFEREYCIKNGDAARPMFGDCVFRTQTLAQAPSDFQSLTMETIVNNEIEVSKSQEDFLSLALSIGQRAALDQAITVDQKLFAIIAQFIRQMADLLNELKRAPVTQTACPWTGPFKVFGS